MANASAGIIHRINSLLNKTVEKGCTVAEAATAANIAQQLLTQHRLTVADLSANGESYEDIHNKEALFSGMRRIHWKDKLANCLTTVNGCMAYVDTVPVYDRGQMRRKNKVYCRIIGRNSDIQICTYFFNYLEREIETLCKAAMKRGEGTGKTWSNSFKNGASDAICNRLREANQDVKTSAANSTALVKLENRDEAVSKWAEDNLKLKNAPEKTVRYSRSGYASGKIAGNNVNLNRGIGAGKDTKQLN